MSRAFLLVALFARLAAGQVTPALVCTAAAQTNADIIITCKGGQAPTDGAPLPQVNISVTLSVNIASIEAMLLIDGTQANPRNTCPAAGCYSLTAGPDGTAMDSNGTVRGAIPGARKNENTMVFTGVPIFAPGTSGSRIFRTKGIRAVAAKGESVFAFISVQNPPDNFQLENATVPLAITNEGPAVKEEKPQNKAVARVHPGQMQNHPAVRFGQLAVSNFAPARLLAGLLPY